MNRKICFVILIICVCFITACGKRIASEKVINQDVEISDSIKYCVKTLESKSYIDDFAAKTYKIVVGDKEYEGEYVMSGSDLTGVIYDEYNYNFKDADGNYTSSNIVVRVSRDDKNELFKIMFSDTPIYDWGYNSKFDNVDEAKIVADEIAKKYINTEDYVLNIQSEYMEYRFEYNRYIDDIKTEEMFCVSFLKNGCSTLIATEYIDKYKDISLGIFDVKKGEEIALDKMKEKYGDNKEYYVGDKYASTVDEKLGVVYVCYSKQDASCVDVVFVYLE